DMISLDGGQLSTAMNSDGLSRGSDAPGAQVGTMLGETAVVLTGEISLEDAAEELTLHMAEKTEDKHHAERKVKAQSPLELLQVHEIIELLNQVRHEGGMMERLKAVARRILAQEGPPLAMAAQGFGDISQQHLALQYALHEGEREGADPAVLEEIRDTLADMELESGPQIRAGIHALRAAGDFAEDAA